MSPLRGRKLKPGIDGSRMALDWRQRAMIVGVPKSARHLLGNLEARATSEPGFVEHVAESVRGWEDDPAMVTFGLLHTPEHTITGVIIVVGKAGIVLLDAKSSHPRAELRWVNLCRFDVKHDRGYQIVGIAWYDGERDIAQRLEEGTGLQLAEMRFAYLYMHAAKEVLSAIRTAFDEAAIPEDVHQRPPLV